MLLKIACHKPLLALQEDFHGRGIVSGLKQTKDFSFITSKSCQTVNDILFSVQFLWALSGVCFQQGGVCLLLRSFSCSLC